MSGRIRMPLALWRFSARSMPPFSFWRTRSNSDFTPFPAQINGMEVEGLSSIAELGLTSLPRCPLRPKPWSRNACPRHCGVGYASAAILATFSLLFVFPLDEIPLELRDTPRKPDPA